MRWFTTVRHSGRSFYFYAQGPLLVVMALAAVNWLRVGWRGAAFLVTRSRARAEADRAN